MDYSKKKNEISTFINGLANQRKKWLKKNAYYYKQLNNFFKYNIPEESSVLEIGCGIGNLLNELKPSYGVGIDISPEMINIAKQTYPDLEFYQMDAEVLDIDKKFDFVIISDMLCYCEDIQKLFKNLKKVVKPETRIIITIHSFLWQPVLYFAEKLNFKMPQKKINWLNSQDVINLLHLEGYDVIKNGKKILFPKYFPIISNFFNRYLGNLPIINKLCLVDYIIGRNNDVQEGKELSVSVIVPARNERGNIENVVRRIPNMGKSVEIIFVEGHSSDNTLEEIKRVCDAYKENRNVKYLVQDGKGKGDAVRKGFSIAQGDILMIQDADLTVPPEDLPKFYAAIQSGKGEYINGSRLVYPLEKESMRLLNIFGNKFFALMFSYLVGQQLKDTLCGTKAIAKNNYNKIQKNRKYFGDFDPFGDFDLIFGSAKLNLKIVEIPVRYEARDYGSSNISRFRHGLLLLKMVFFAINKIKFI